jgi:heme-degrading monooxygenase HmoA
MINPETIAIPDATATPAAGGCPFHQANERAADALVVTALAAKTTSTFVALSKFVIANDMIAEVKAAFRDRPHLVDGQPGFERMEVLSPLDRPEEIWLVTYWTDAASYDRWHHSHLYHESHQGIPKGLKLVPGETKIRRFEHVAS